MKNKESLGESGSGASWDMSDMPKNPTKKEALPSDVLGESKARNPEAFRESVNNDPAENEAVKQHLEGAKDSIVAQLEKAAMDQAFNKLGNPNASTAEVAKNAEMAETVRAEVFMGMALDGAELYAEATGGSICDGIRKQMELYDKRLAQAGKNDAVKQASWSDAKHWGGVLLDQMQGYQSATGGKEALPSDVL